MKPTYPTCVVSVGGAEYTVHLRVTPGRGASHAGPDSPSYLRPGIPRQVKVIRILRAQIDVTEELTYWTRRAIEEKAIAKAKQGSCVGTGALSFSVEDLR